MKGKHEICMIASSVMQELARRNLTTTELAAVLAVCKELNQFQRESEAFLRMEESLAEGRKLSEQLDEDMRRSNQ